VAAFLMVLAPARNPMSRNTGGVRAADHVTTPVEIDDKIAGPAANSLWKMPVPDTLTSR
jgi:hypothetical protein